MHGGGAAAEAASPPLGRPVRGGATESSTEDDEARADQGRRRRPSRQRRQSQQQRQRGGGGKGKVKGGRARRHRTASPPPSGASYGTTLSLSASDLRRSSTGIGYAFAALILGLYALGCAASILSLPDPDPAVAAGRAALGAAGRLRTRLGGVSLNVAMGGLVPVREGGRAAAGGDGTHLRGGTDLAAGAAGEAGRSPPAPVPEHKWPASILYEDGTFEDIVHPGDPSTTMAVPRFWSPPLHGGGLMSRDLAMSVGSCIAHDPATGSLARGDACPEKDRTIFVAIASYRDWQCRYTVESIFQRAKYPDRVRVGVVDQIDVDDGDFQCEVEIKPCAEDPEQALCKYRRQVDVFRMHAKLAVGPVFARHIGNRMYRGEYYAMQSDAHVTYTQDWDVDIIGQQEATGDEMAVQTTYLTDIVDSIDEETGKSLRKTRPIMCNTDYEGGAQGKHLRHMSQPERIPSITGMPQLEPYWAAGFSFSRGHFIVNVPYDQYQPMIFQGEEMSMGIRGFTIGYDYFATQRSICFHHYAEGVNKQKRGKVKTFWEHSNTYKGTGKKAMKRLLGIVHMNPEVSPTEWDHSEEDLYGIGGVRTPEKFYKTIGIDVVKKTTEHNLCRFVQPGVMHRTFMKFLRPDGMGINYDKIDYKFKDPAKQNQNVDW